MAKISVIVPVYKVEKYLGQCVDSIIKQTYKNLEIILVDDGSPDNCGAICDEYAAKDERIVVIHQKNGGLSAARNAGLDIASGEYIAFIDSDDWIAENMIELLLGEIQRFQADMAICDVAVYHPGKGVISHECPMKDECFPQADLIKKMMADHAWHYIIACNKLYRREIFSEIRFPDGYIHEDAAIAHRVAGVCNTVVTLAKELYFYRQNPESITGSTFSIQRTDNLSALADRIQYAYHQKWAEMWEQTAVRFSYTFLDFFFRFDPNEQNGKYFNRMRKSLKIALPYIVRAKAVPVKMKLYMIAIWVSPSIVRWVKS